MKGFYHNSSLHILFIQDIIKFPRYVTFFEYPGHLCAIDDMTRQYKLPKDFINILNIKKPHCVVSDLSNKNLVLCKDHFKIGSINFISNFNYTYKPKKHYFSQEITSDVPCTNDKSENTTLKVHYLCGKDQYDVFNFQSKHQCHYVLDMSVSKLCKYNHKYFSDDPNATDYPINNVRNIYCMDEKLIPSDFRNSIIIDSNVNSSILI